MNLTFRVHAIQRMFERGVTVADVRAALEDGEVIEDYAYYAEYPGTLMLRRDGRRARRAHRRRRDWEPHDL